jgi:hypothetical protein
VIVIPGRNTPRSVIIRMRSGTMQVSPEKNMDLSHGYGVRE